MRGARQGSSAGGGGAAAAFLPLLAVLGGTLVAAAGTGAEPAGAGPCPVPEGAGLDGDDLLAPVDREAGHHLARTYVPRDLVPVDPSRVRPRREAEARLVALLAFYEMAHAARAEAGLELKVVSGYRSFERQCKVYARRLREAGKAHTERSIAPPGRSEHQLGTAFDLTSRRLGRRTHWRLETFIGRDEVGRWLRGQAHRFGFALSYPRGREAETGYAYEPWHYRYVGRAAGAELHRRRETLHAYLARCARSPRARCPREPAVAVRPNAGFVGGACRTTADCRSLGPAARCLRRGYPGGSCTVPCGGGCPSRAGPNAEARCARVGRGSAPSCHPACDRSLFPATGCRPGYRCRASRGESEPVCVPERRRRRRPRRG